MSEAVRSRLILIANVIGTLSKTPELNARGLSIVAYLRTEAHQAIAHFHSNKLSGRRELEMQEASRSLDHMIEASKQRDTSLDPRQDAAGSRKTVLADAAYG